MKNIKTYPKTEKILEDSLVDILDAIHGRTSSTETIIVSETQQTNESFYYKPCLVRDEPEEKKTLKMKTKLKKWKIKIIAKRNNKKKNLLKQKNNYKQIE